MTPSGSGCTKLVCRFSARLKRAAFPGNNGGGHWLIGAVEMIGGSASMGAGVFLTWLCRGGPPDVAHIVTIPIVVLLLLIVGLSLVIGYMHLSQQKPDGHSIIWNSNSISTTFHSGQLPFDCKNFEPVARVTIENPAIAVKASSQFRTLNELIDYAKANPDKVRVGNSGAGSHTHIAAVALSTCRSVLGRA